jgi:hypothetical protein
VWIFLFVKGVEDLKSCIRKAMLFSWAYLSHEQFAKMSLKQKKLQRHEEAGIQQLNRIQSETVEDVANKKFGLTHSNSQSTDLSDLKVALDAIELAGTITEQSFEKNRKSTTKKTMKTRSASSDLSAGTSSSFGDSVGDSSSQESESTETIGEKLATAANFIGSFIGSRGKRASRRLSQRYR